jgi:hypothetical protein
VLLSDSVTALWPEAATGKELAGLRIANRGIPGNETAHMRSRFHHDVIRLNLRVAVIQGGINDFVRVPLTSTEQSLEAMADQANEMALRSCWRRFCQQANTILTLRAQGKTRATRKSAS